MPKPKIMIVDDEPTVLLHLTLELEDEGYQTLPYLTGERLLTTIEREQPDLVILDIKLNEPRSGIDLLGDIRRKYYDLPVILYTAYSSFTDDLRTIAADYYEVKSADAKPLKQKIAMALEARPAMKLTGKRAELGVERSFSLATAHKIGNPVFALETDISTLRTKIQNSTVEDAASFFSRIDASLEKIKKILDQLKSLSKAGELSIHPVDIIGLIRCCCDIAKQHGADVCFETDLGAAQAWVDSDRIIECFDELVTNSLQWCERADNKIRITVKIAEIRRDSHLGSPKYFHILFGDNGYGIPTEKKNEIFTSFFTTGKKGAGLGLSIVRQHIIGHYGSIKEIGEPGKGALFEILLPKTIMIGK